MGNKEISIFDLMEENIYLDLNNEGKEKILTEVIKKYDTLSNFPDKTLYDVLTRLKLGKKISIKNLFKIIKELKLSEEFIEKTIINITSFKNTDIGLKNPKLPFNFKNKETARIIAGILGDGSISRNLLVDYHNQQKILIKLISESGKKVFGDIDEKIYLKKCGTYQLHWPKIIGIFLFHLGLYPGYKVITNQNIPPVIMSSNKDIKKMFIRQFFNDEGNVRLKDRRLQVKQTIVCNKPKNIIKNNLNKYSPNVLKDIQKLLSELSVQSKISLAAYRKTRDSVKTDWELSIYGKENLEKFQKFINFDLNYKRTLLDKALKSYKFPSAPRNGKLVFALEKCKLVQKKHGFIRKDLLAKEAKRSLKVATYYLIELKKKGLIEITKKPRTKYGHPKPFLYKMTNSHLISLIDYT